MTRRAYCVIGFVLVALQGCASTVEPLSHDAAAPADSGSDAAASVDSGEIPFDPDDRCNTEGAFEALVSRDGETCYELLAHNGAWEGDPLELVQDEHLNQLYYEIPWPENSVATRFGVRRDDITSVHRVLLFESNMGSHGQVEHDAAGWLYDTDAKLVAGWSVGGCNVEMPSDVGLELASPSSGKLLMAQWHHFNLTGETQHDASRIQICVVPRSARAHIGSITILGTENLGGLEGMPVAVESTFAGTCLNETSDPITVVGLWPHMHEIGTRVRTELISADGAVATVFDKPFQHEENRHYATDPRIVVEPGDKLRVACTYFNSTPNKVSFGISLVQEQCYQFAFSYPAGALDNALNPSLIGAINICWGD